jgi:hypothetical protein
MVSSKLGAIAFIAALGVGSALAAMGVASPAFAQAGDYNYHARPGWPIRNPNPWANDYRLKHHHVARHVPSKAQ